MSRVNLWDPTMCLLPLKIPLWFWLPFSSLLKLLPRRGLFSHSLGISTLTQCLEGWQAAGNCHQLSEMSSSWKYVKSVIEKTIWPVSCSLSRLGRSSVIRIQSGRSTSDSHTKSTFKETVFYSGVKLIRLNVHLLESSLLMFNTIGFAVAVVSWVFQIEGLCNE